MLLLTLHSIEGDKAAFGYFDPEVGALKCLQIVRPSSQILRPMVRGMSVLGDRLYTLTPASLCIYKASEKPGPPLQLEKEIILPEWIIMGRGDKQAHLVSILASAKRNQVLVGNNSRCSIDFFSLDGEFLRRRHMWEIAPKLFPLPETPRPNFTFGTIRSISESPDGAIYITMIVPPKQTGMILDLDSGELLAKDLENPVGPSFYNGHTYLQLSRQKALLKLPPSSGKMSLNTETPDWAISLPVDDDRSSMDYIFRGLAVVNGTIYSGVGRVGTKDKIGRYPYLVAFSEAKGLITDRYALPSTRQMPLPYAFDVTPLPEWLEPNIPDEEECVFYDRGQRFTPEIIAEQTPAFASGVSGHSVAYADESKQPVKRGPARIIFDDVAICFKRNARFAIGRDKHLRKSKDFWALRGVSFYVREGETIGIIGRNGSGKSTLSLLCTGVLSPDRGVAYTSGRVQLLALGVGFKGEMTGRQNIFISASLLGIPRKIIRDKIPDIEEFTELGEFLDEPVRTYSSGMRSRLAFSISTIVEPDVLILDEVMSTGDTAFRNKAKERMEMMRDRARTVIMISHSFGQLHGTCDRILWMEKGRLLMDGNPETVISAYQTFCRSPSAFIDENPFIAKILEQTEKVE